MAHSIGWVLAVVAGTEFLMGISKASAADWRSDRAEGIASGSLRLLGHANCRYYSLGAIAGYRLRWRLSSR